jgi:hypothetical protein
MTSRSPRLVVMLLSCSLMAACSSGASPGSSTGGGGTLGSGGSKGSGGSTGAGGGGSGTGGAGQGGAGQAGASGAGGSTASGGAGGGGAPDGGASGPVTPAMASGRYQFSFGDVVLEIDPMDGGRVSKLALSGTDLIVSSGTDPTTWGSVFWTSPRSSWPGTMWPPPAAIDNAAYTASLSGAHVVVSGPTEPTLGVNMKKDYAADASGWITINYTINATKALKAAPWEVSRVPRGGIVFFPVGSSLTAGPLMITQSAGIAWFDDSSKSVTSPNGDKCYADGMGWTAYVAGGNLFLKKFMDQPASAEAPGEGEVDVYPGNGFLEFEVEGPYTSIAASGNLPWSIQWRVAKVPSTVTIGVGSTTLVNFAKQLLTM